jgi:plastocyanin
MRNANLEFLFVISIMGLALLLTACSSNPTNSSGNNGGGVGGGSGNTVSISGFKYAPGSLTVKAGTTVIWTNKDASTHTVTSDNGAFTSSGNLATNDTYSFIFTTAGSFPYHCAIHPSMKGTIVVTP